MERPEPSRTGARNCLFHLCILGRSHGKFSFRVGLRQPVGVDLLKDEPNPYRSKLLEETVRERSLVMQALLQKRNTLTRKEKAAQVYGGVLGGISGISLFWTCWWGIQYIWPTFF